MRIAFHGANAAAFSEGFATLLGGKGVAGAEVVVLPDQLDAAAERDAYAEADVVIGIRFDASLPRPERLRLFHLPAAGYDAVDFAALPQGAMVCNCFGHEHAIAEYVLAAMLQRTVPLADADRKLRQGEWAYWAGSPARLHGEMAGTTLGLLGFGHIGKAVAVRARAFGLRVHVANRSRVPEGELVDRYFPLPAPAEFWQGADTVVVTVPLTPDTRGIVGRDALAAMRGDAVLVNVARGPVVDEQALFDALRDRRIGGAVIDTWYQYPAADDACGAPSSLPFHELPNLLMTPHMSGWTRGTICRRQETMADNIRRRMRGEPCENVLHGG